MVYKCYNIPEGCMGLIDDSTYQLFSFEGDYREWFEEHSESSYDS